MIDGVSSGKTKDEFIGDIIYHIQIFQIFVCGKLVALYKT